MNANTPMIDQLRAENATLHARVVEIEQRLRDLEAHNRALLDAIPDLMFRITRDGIFVAYKAERDDELAAPPDVFLGKRIHDVIPPDVAIPSMERIEQALNTGKVQTYEYTMTLPGGPRSFEARYSRYDEHEVILLIRDVTQRKQIEQELHVFKALIDRAPDGIVVAHDSTRIYANHAYSQLLGYESTVGLTRESVTPASEHGKIEQILAHIRQHGSWQGPYEYLRKDGSTVMTDMSAFAFNRTSDQADSYDVSTLGIIVRDMTRHLQQDAERQQLQQQIIDAQQAAIRELSTPLIPLSPSVVLMPLIGSIDSYRAQLVMETLLDGIALHQAETAILDITGLSVVDTGVANALIQAAQAVKLLGAQVVLTGIGPAMAQSLVHLCTDLTSIITRGSLQSAVVEAVRAV